MKETKTNKRLTIAIIAIAVLAIGIVVAVLILNRNSDKVSRFDWIERICDISDICDYETDKPFYDDVDRDDSRFSLIQAAVEADVIPITDKFNGDKPVTGEFAVVTALRAVDEYKRTRLHDVDDKTDEDYLAYALESGLIEKSEISKKLPQERCDEIFDAISIIIRGGEEPENITSHSGTSANVDIFSNDNGEDGTTEAAVADTEEATESASANENVDVSGVILDQHYTTKYGQINAITCPTFTFDYPSNWEVVAEEYDSAGGIIEMVTLRDDNGATIMYMHHGEGAFGPALKNGTITEVAQSKMIPSYPAGTDTDCSYLGEFVVALADEGEEYSLFGSYAVIPMTNTGDFTDIGNRLSFAYPELWYMFVSYPPSNYNEAEGYSETTGYNEQEIKEIVAIMSSFRIED